ncbi:IS1182-like element ISAzch1 family transposase [Azotobacter chroococcum]|uniref:Transposase, IS4 family n=1 Tax=Azotobacter chroococcum NCIMB 8003 TaxID=1328314 RepID=A0A0C4WIF8_9GAMM|nr:IS1182-like element ISAzch1 family transposase [Azotobacter chroococcum]AJE21943.1 Transposase, IS4 family [Azotobacter chroococcum NCIMB 8003]
MSGSSGELFDDLPIPEARPAPPLKAAARVRHPNRDQIELRPSDLESLLSEDHPARLVWGYVERQDLSPLYAGIKAVDGACGRSAIAPEILLALWLYATLEGVGSARALARLCEAHDAYRWLCGGVQVNHHTLSDFRVGQGAFLDRLLTANVASLLATGAVTMKRVAQDGMRVRAHAGAASFRRKERLQQFHMQARQQVEALKREVRDDPAATERRQQAARERAAREREERIAKALAQLPKVEKIKQAQGKPVTSARVSTTDAEACVMKMPDGGFRPAYNMQLATDTASQVIVGVDVVTRGSDLGQLAPMVEQLDERYERRPQEMLVDGGFAKHDDIERLAPTTTVYAPPPKPRDATRDPHAALPDDSETIAAWRERMGTEAAKAIYKERAATAECVNALARNRGLQRFNVCGLDKVKSVLLWYALAHNLMRMLKLAPGLLGVPTMT